MNAKQLWRSQQLSAAYVEKLDMKTDTMIFFALNKVISAKTIDDNHAALEYLLGAIVSGQQYENTATHQ